MSNIVQIVEAIEYQFASDIAHLETKEQLKAVNLLIKNLQFRESTCSTS